MFGAENAVLRPVAYDLNPGAHGKGQGPKPFRGRFSGGLEAFWARRDNGLGRAVQTGRNYAIVQRTRQDIMAEQEPKSIFEPDEVEEARLDAEAMAAYRAGRFVPHAKVAEWLDSWGTPNELPCPKPEPR